MTKASKAPKRKNERDASVAVEQDEDVVDRLIRRYLPVLRQLHGDCQYLLTVLDPDTKNNGGGIDENEQRLGQFLNIVDVVINKITSVEKQDKSTVNFRKMEALEESIVGTILPVRDRLQEKWKENEKKRARHTRATDDDKNTFERGEGVVTGSAPGGNNNKRQKRTPVSVVSSGTSASSAGAESGSITVKMEDASMTTGAVTQDVSTELVGEDSVTVIDNGSGARTGVVFRSEAKPVSAHGMGIVSQGMLTVDAAGGITRDDGGEVELYPLDGAEAREVAEQARSRALSGGGQSQAQLTRDALGEGFSLNLDMCDEVSIFDGPMGRGHGALRSRGPQSETWHKPAGETPAPQSWPPPDSALSSVSGESAYLPPQPQGYCLPVGLTAQTARAPRTADYCCSICLGTYQMVVQDNPWWAVYQHECPHCGIVQVPRIDISAPTSAPASDRHATAVYTDDGGVFGPGPGPGDGSPMNFEEIGPPGERRDSNATDRISFDSNDSLFNRLLEEPLQEGVTPSIPQTILQAVPSQTAYYAPAVQPVQLSPPVVQQPVSMVYPVIPGGGAIAMDGISTVSGLSRDDQAKLLVLISHARSCTGAHSGPAHEEVCRNAKRLILHASACAGWDGSGASCTFPWCLPCRSMLSHLAQCYHPGICQVCNPWSLTRPYELGRQFSP